MRKYATITIQVEANDGLSVLDHVTDGMPILGISLTYSDDLAVDSAVQIQALADELDAEAAARRQVQTDCDRLRATLEKYEAGMRAMADAYAVVQGERDYARSTTAALEAELKPFRKLGNGPNWVRLYDKERSKT